MHERTYTRTYNKVCKFFTLGLVTGQHTFPLLSHWDTPKLVGKPIISRTLIQNRIQTQVRVERGQLVRETLRMQHTRVSAKLSLEVPTVC